MNRRLNTFVLMATVLAATVGVQTPALGDGPDCGTGDMAASLGQDAANLAGSCESAPSKPANEGSSDKGAEQVDADGNEYRIVPACEPVRISDTVGGDATNCSYAQTACTYRLPASDPKSGEILYRLESRPKSDPNGAWTLVREMCGLAEAPPGVPAPPAIPTLAQIQNAFRRLPFSRPSVGVEPEGNKTLVNLPTYFRAEWPGDAGLQPGEVSKPVQLLTWSVEFKIAARSYDFHYGDGTSSGPTSDPGGVYPDGAIRHTYTRPTAAARVSVDAQLTAQYRANGGPWQDIDSAADLQDEPVTTVQVREAHARLVTH